ncbi:MAG TPA: flagellar protein FlgN [Lachnospiraceae bacterium]|nr:flagellar protein FlgN [Lachnospiraceae bacterium]
MASLIEELLDVLEKENSEYEILLELSERKTPVIIRGDIVELQKITDEEQNVVNKISRLEQKRETVTSDIANVINKDVETLKLSVLIQLLEKQPKEQERLAVVHDRLQTTVNNIRMINGQNAELIKQSLEMVTFDLNLVQAMKQAPETANYNKGAINAGDTLGTAGSFDAKQ